jgi:hypothetical protein
MFTYGFKVGIRFVSVILQFNTTVLMTRNTVQFKHRKTNDIMKTLYGQP